MDMLTRLEELILLAVLKLEDDAYGTTIFNHLLEVTGRKLSLGGVYFPLDRLTRRGYLEAYTGDATPQRKGLSKRYYRLTVRGLAALEDIRRIHDAMWPAYEEDLSRKLS
ncbi:MAG: PadR family transcriptional regulator [Acidobacteria bacterium]|nr:PadR family transcriptional regulator [Acidobacteriota bacterium]